MTDGEVDLALLSDKVGGLDQIIPRLHDNAPHVPVIVLANAEASEWTPSQALTLGAADCVPQDDSDLVGLVVLRELANVCRFHDGSQLRRALKEAEERCQLLMQGSKAAIAYIHEGCTFTQTRAILASSDMAISTTFTARLWST